jgi:hypothetical protein
MYLVFNNMISCFFCFFLSSVFADVWWRSSDPKGSLRRPQRPCHLRFQLPHWGASPSTELPHGELPEVGGRRVDSGKSYSFFSFLQRHMLRRSMLFFSLR